jgi:hypothetical protein
MRQKFRMDELQGETPISRVIQELKNDGYSYETLVDDDGTLNSLFFIHPESLEFARNFPSVFVMDATYKTNKYSMPLLNITGISSTFSSFNAGFIFLRAETEQYYTWALGVLNRAWGFAPKTVATDRELALMNSIKTVWPTATNLLCAWHINKNVLAKTIKHFENGHAHKLFMRMVHVLICSICRPVSYIVDETG